MLRLRTAALVAASALAALSLATAACGDDDDESADPGDGSPAAGESRTVSATARSSVTPSTGGDGDGSATADSGGGSVTPTPASGNGASPSPAPTFEIVTPVATATFVAAEGEYCDTVTATSPPNTLFGLLEIDGEPLPAGTDVRVAFDGVPGPVKATREAGGYRVDFGTTKDTACANREGAALSVIVDGVQYATGRTAGSAPAIRFDIVE
jgi:hypothetical protein